MAAVTGEPYPLAVLVGLQPAERSEPLGGSRILARGMDGVWEVLRARLDYASLVPRPIDAIVRGDLRKRDGTPYTVLKNPRGDGGAGTYVTLERPDVELFELMDGQRTTTEILVEHLQRSGVFALDRLGRLTAALAANGFFGEERPDPWTSLRRRRAQRDPFVRLSLLLRRLVFWNIASWPNAEQLVEVLYRAGGRLFFTRAGALAVLAFSAAGLALWVREFSSPRHDLFRVGESYVAGLVSLVVLQVLSISIHEAGHALAIRHFGRRVRRLGLAIYYLFPCMYVDSTDMVLAPRSQRMVVSLAGPLAGVTVAAAAMVVVVTTTDPVAASIGLKAATLLIFQFVLNLLPILDLDGYHVLVDALDAPLLRQRAIGFVRGSALRKLRRRDRWTRAEIGLATYGVLAIVVSLSMLVFAAWIWQERVKPVAGELLGTGIIGPVLLALLVLVFIGPIVVALAGRVAGMIRTAIRLAGARRRKRLEAERRAEMALLSRVRFLNGLTPAALAAIADHLVEERVEPGQVVVTVGEPGDKFYLVVSGRLEVLSAPGEVLGGLVPGDGFGELALLARTPRRATVRATEPTVLWSLDRGHFHRWVRDRFEVAARIRASTEEREKLGSLPFFAGLQPHELMRIAAKLRTVRVAAGDAVLHAGDPGDRFYVIREGTAEVFLPDGLFVREMGPGSTFGELALLFGMPRTTTVTAKTDLTLGALARDDFAALVRASGETMGRFKERTAHYVGAGIGSAVAEAR